jgi:hypothetical protein
MKGERRLGSFDQLGDAYNKPVIENGDFENQKGKNPKIEKKDTTPKKDPQPQKAPRPANKNEILPDDNKRDGSPDRTPIGFKQKSKVEPKTKEVNLEKDEEILKNKRSKWTVSPAEKELERIKEERQRFKPVNATPLGEKNQIAKESSNRQERVPRKAPTIQNKENKFTPKTPFQKTQNSGNKTTEIIQKRSQPQKSKLASANAGPHVSLEKYAMEGDYDESTRQIFNAKPKVDSESKVSFSQRTNDRGPVRVITAHENDKIEDGDFDALNLKKFRRGSYQKKGFAEIPKKRTLSKKPMDSFDPAILDKMLEVPTNTEEKGIVKKARSIIDKINQGSIQKPADSSERKLVWPLKSRTANSEFTVLDRNTQRYGVAGSQESVVGTKKSPEPKISPEPATVSKSLDETLDEMEKKARASIKESADKTADKALEGNQSEIDASTIRINQHNTLKENIANLQKKRDLMTQGNDQSFDNTLVQQIDDQIAELKNLSPYKSPEVEIADQELQKHEDTETLSTETKTVNESFANDEKNQNDTFNPGEKTVAEAYQEGILKPLESKIDTTLNPENEVSKSPELLALEQARAVYAEKQKSFLDNKRKTQNSINKIRDFFGFGKKVKEEDLPQELKELKSSYDQTKVSFIKSLINEQIRKIDEKATTGEITEEGKSEALHVFMKGGLFDEIVVKEHESLLALQAETLPAKEKGIFKKALDGYLKLKPWQRTVISTAMLTGVMVTTGAIASASAAASYGATRVAKSTLYGATIGKLSSTLMGQAYDTIIGDSKENTELSKKKISEEFSRLIKENGDIDQVLEKVERKYSKRLTREKTEKYGKIVAKALFGMGMAVSTSDMTNDLAEGVSSVSEKIVSTKNSVLQGIQNADVIKNVTTLNALNDVETGVSEGIKKVDLIKNVTALNALNDVETGVSEGIKKVDLVKNVATLNALNEIETGASEGMKKIGELDSVLQNKTAGVRESLKEFFDNTKESSEELLDKAKSKIDELTGSREGNSEAPDTATTQSEEPEIEQEKVTTPEEKAPRTPPSEPKIEPSQPKIPEDQTPPAPKSPTPETSTVSVEADKLGAIETFKDLKEKLAQSYPDPKLAPANVREILAGDPTSLAIKYGFYNPSQSAESAMLLKGEQLGFDAKGNLYFKDINGTIDTLSQNDGFGGKMIDSVPDKNIQAEPQENPYKNIVPREPVINSSVVGPETNPYANITPEKPIISSIEKSPYADVVPVKPEITLRGNTYYSPDKEIDAMTPIRNTPPSTFQNQESAREILTNLDSKSIHSLAEKNLNSDIDKIFQKPNFLFGGSTPGTKTEEWVRTLKFIDEKKALGTDLFEAMDAQQLQNTQEGEFFTLGEYARSLRNETGLVPNDGELLKDYFIRANEYKIAHNISDKEMLKIIDEADTEKKIQIDESTRNKIRARRSVDDNDGVYN